ncbi:hypothetical protein [Streptosporangium pseudovulgare]|uniref:Uncharacterized protein n=1 Tax=Streptosporangium pseudovulgare TaxID=35765 RepID=A0ABQ2R1V6_9ACTN|nr:hypothetical protein [Streptosporangium pseudovulgare]GGQ09293.1 hypothetical protein GCM10010140_44330 [Streptosporangium pseudovulgare]
MPNNAVHGDSDQFTARLVATAAAPLDPASADGPQVLHWPGRRLLVQRGDTELAIRDLDGEGLEVRFPAPWPRRYGSVAVSPTGDLAVFAGVHALRAVDSTGAVRWELRHGCWSAAVCAEAHASFSEYADDHHHGHADSGSAAFSSDGRLLWAHIRSHAGHDTNEEWLILDPADGTVLARAETMTVGSGSAHFPHPNPAYMGLTVGEGEEDSPVLWGHWDGARLTVRRFVEEVLLAVSPSGECFLTTDPGQWSLYLHRAEDGLELRRLDAEEAVPPPSGEDDRARWDYEAAFPYDDTAVVGTEHHTDAVPRHWVVDPRTMGVRGRIVYPFPIAGSPRSAGEAAWYTVSRDQTTLHLWDLPHRE